MMKVIDVKKILQSAISVLNDYEDDAELSMQSNTYFINHARSFLGCRDGYLPLDPGLIGDAIVEKEESEPRNIDELIDAFYEGDIDAKTVSYYAQEKGWTNSSIYRQFEREELNESFKTIYKKANLRESNEQYECEIEAAFDVRDDLDLVDFEFGIRQCKLTYKIEGDGPNGWPMILIKGTKQNIINYLNDYYGEDGSNAVIYFEENSKRV